MSDQRSSSSTPTLARVCPICDHPLREQIETEILTNQSSSRQVSQRYLINLRAVTNHRSRHMRDLTIPNVTAPAPAGSTTVVTRDQVTSARQLGVMTIVDTNQRFVNEGLRLLELARTTENPTLTLQAIRAYSQLVPFQLAAQELLARLEGELGDGTQTTTNNIDKAVIVMPTQADLARRRPHPSLQSTSPTPPVVQFPAPKV